MLRTISTLFLLFIAIICVAADLDYIMAFKPPVTAKTYAKARSDVEAAGGQVKYEFHSAFKGILVSLPPQDVTTFSTKEYVDFIEEDKSVHITS